jgi:tripartite-type tricarboxylate transporter receptor subunit TctC
MFNRRFVTCGLAIFLTCSAGAALAQQYPTKPIRLIVPFGPGSTADTIARVIGNSVGSDLGQNVVVDNRPGAGGTIGGAEAARAAGDGYTLVLGTVASHAVGPLTMQNVSYDPIANFEPITLIVDAPAIIVVHSSVPASNLKELIDYIKANPGMNYTSAGTGTTTHIAGEALKLKAGLNMTHVPYKAAGQAISDIVSGQVKMMIYQIPAVRQHIETGALKAIATTSAKRTRSFPNVPAVAETYPDFDFSAWFGIMAPAQTPKPVVEQLHKSILKAMDTSELKQQLATQGLDPIGLGPDQFRALIVSALPKWKELIELTGTKAQ